MNFLLGTCCLLLLLGEGVIGASVSGGIRARRTAINNIKLTQRFVAALDGGSRALLREELFDPKIDMQYVGTSVSREHVSAVHHGHWKGLKEVREQIGILDVLLELGYGFVLKNQVETDEYTVDLKGETVSVSFYLEEPDLDTISSVNLRLKWSQGKVTKFTGHFVTLLKANGASKEEL